MGIAAPNGEAEERLSGPLPQAALDNIETVKRLRGEAWARRSWGEKAADAIGSRVGRVEFVVFHVLWFALWAAFNTRLVPALPVFDPYPFNLFGTLISFEAVVVSALVLIKQNRMSLLDERRSHVELQMTLLSEKEITKLLRIMEHVTTHLGIEGAVDEETRELREHTQVEEVARAVRETLPE